jgi:CheY-like chemotaxis protein
MLSVPRGETERRKYQSRFRWQVVFETILGHAKSLCIWGLPFYATRMSEPLALVLGQRGVIASQLTQRLEQLHYRVKVISNPSELAGIAEQHQAMIVLADAEDTSIELLTAINRLHLSPATSHIPIIAFARDMNESLQGQLTAKGATMSVPETAVLDHLPQLLSRALEIP